MSDIPYKHIDANYIDDIYMLHNESSVYGEPNPILPIGAIFILICSSLCCSYQSGQYFISDFLNRRSDIQECIITSNALNEYLDNNTHNSISNDNTDCCICLDKFEGNNTNYIVLECSHRFHRNCISNWFKKELNCPLCRKKIEL
jgi:hypothetical protein